MPEGKQAEDHKDGGSESGSRWCELYKTEDYWAIWLGLAIILVGLFVFMSHPPDGMEETIRESNATMAKEAAAPQAVPRRTERAGRHRRRRLLGTSRL